MACDLQPPSRGLAVDRHVNICNALAACAALKRRTANVHSYLSALVAGRWIHPPLAPCADEMLGGNEWLRAE